MQELVKVNEFIDYIERLNKALDSVGYGGQFIPATFDPKVGVIVGPNAKMITQHLYSSGKIDKYYEFKHKGSEEKNNLLRVTWSRFLTARVM
jgi:hypothetical protein